MTAYPETIVVSITQEHIDQGERGNASACPVALAFRDALRGAGFVRKVSCWREAAVLDAQYKEVARYDPNGAFPWAQRFDSREPVEPATFTFTKLP